MSKNSFSCAALLGFVLTLPLSSWSQSSVPIKSSPETTWLAAARYGDARELERAGQWSAAMQAYQDAAERGHGPAQRRLGDIYANGQGDVRRDYETSLRWYRRAREKGEGIPLPFTYPGVRRY
jgi:TPR repeat protein